MDEGVCQPLQRGLLQLLQLFPPFDQQVTLKSKNLSSKCDTLGNSSFQVNWCHLKN